MDGFPPSPLQPFRRMTRHRAPIRYFSPPFFFQLLRFYDICVDADDEVFIEIIGTSPSVQIQAIRVSEGAQTDGHSR